MKKHLVLFLSIVCIIIGFIITVNTDDTCYAINDHFLVLSDVEFTYLDKDGLFMQAGQVVATNQTIALISGGKTVARLKKHHQKMYYIEPGKPPIYAKKVSEKTIRIRQAEIAKKIKETISSKIRNVKKKNIIEAQAGIIEYMFTMFKNRNYIQGFEEGYARCQNKFIEETGVSLDEIKSMVNGKSTLIN